LNSPLEQREPEARVRSEPAHDDDDRRQACRAIRELARAVCESAVEPTADFAALVEATRQRCLQAGIDRLDELDKACWAAHTAYPARASTTRGDHTVTADDLFRRPVTASPWPAPVSPRLAVVALGAVAADPLAIDAIETLGVALADLREQLDATQRTCRAGIAELAAVTRDRDRTRARYHALLDERRRVTPVITRHRKAKG
jgi:hypothetical protein